MNNKISKIIAWHPVLTDHLAYTYRELSSQSELPLTVYVSKFEDVLRKSQGWSDASVVGLDRHLIPSVGFLRYAIRSLINNRDQIHLFGSVFESPRMFFVLWLATRLKIKCYLISEPYSHVPYGYFFDRLLWLEQLKTWIRPWLYRVYILALRRGLFGVFTISRLALRQYEQAGMPLDRLFPFGYFVPKETFHEKTPSINPINEKKSIKLAFVGSLISRKGLPMLIAAVRSAVAQNANVQLDVFGPGEHQKFDFDGNIVRYMGTIPFGETQRQLNGYDFLVLPSHYDGWGVVVNEAICAGVPVLCSDQVGARELVEIFGAGQIFPSGDVQTLAKKILELSNDTSQIIAMKLACADTAEVIQPKQAAEYILDILSADRTLCETIPCPWAYASKR